MSILSTYLPSPKKKPTLPSTLLNCDYISLQQCMCLLTLNFTKKNICQQVLIFL